MDEPIFISVVMLTRNRAGMLTATITSIRGQEYPSDRFEIVVVDDGSTDNTADAVRSFDDGKNPVVRYVKQAPLGVNAARNNGIQQARSEFIVLTDDDVEVSKDWLKVYADAQGKYSDAAVFGGPVYPRYEGEQPLPHICGDCGTLEELEQFTRGDHAIEVSRLIGTNLALRRSAWSQVGPFDVSVNWGGAPDEAEWLWRVHLANLKIMYIPGVWLWHRRSTNNAAKALLSRRFLKSRSGIWYTLLTGTGAHMPAVWPLIRGICRGTAHLLRRRCFLGLVKAAAHAGILAGLGKWVWLRSSRTLSSE